MQLAELKLDDPVKRQVADAGITTDVWPVWVGRRPVAMAIAADGVRVFDGVGAWHYGWSTLAELRLERYAVYIRPEGEAEGTRWGLAQRAHGPEIRDAVRAAGGPLTDPPEATTTTTRQLAPAPAARRDPAHQALTTLATALAAGAVIQLLGGLLVTAYDDSFDAGSEVGVDIGMFLIWAGGIGVLLGVVGLGVLLGLRAARSE